MADIGRTSARLRKTFKYPADVDVSDDEPEAMDEEEQDRYIERLAAENLARNKQFKTILYLLPTLSCVPYLVTLFTPRTSLLSLLSITSLLSTTYLLHILPLNTSGFPALDAWANRDSANAAVKRERMGKKAIGGESPLEVWLPWLNLGLVAVIMLLGAVIGSSARGALGWIGLGNFPGLIFGVVVLAKMVMGSVDPEAELSGLRYEYKGA